MLLTTTDIARAFGTVPRAVHRWEEIGVLPRAGRTPGGHRRWPVAPIAAILLERGFAVPTEWNAAVAA